MQLSVLLLTLICGLAGFVRATEEVTYCNATQACPQEKPCCSQDGVCGTGLYCLSSCNPMFSFNTKSCMPMPICKDSVTKFSNYTSKLIDANTFLGDVSKGDWTVSGNVLDYPEEDSMILAMPKNSGGTVLTSTRSVWYGKISARIKSSHLAGVITAFILFSGVRDEIDYEFVGSALDIAETNFYWQGALNYTNSQNISTTDTFENFHTYEVDWHEDYITWSLDGVVGRTLYKNETYNETSKQYQYPQTPSRVHLSIWPGGNATNAPGTIAWAGGEINWNAPDIKDPGYYYAIVNEVNITCYDHPSYTPVNGSTAYVYNSDTEFFSENIAITNASVVLGSDKATGEDPNLGAPSSSSVASKSTKISSKMSSTTSTSSALYNTTSNGFQNSTAYSNNTSGSSTSLHSTPSSVLDIRTTEGTTRPSSISRTNSFKTSTRATSSISSQSVRTKSNNNAGLLHASNLLACISLIMGLLL